MKPEREPSKRGAGILTMLQPALRRGRASKVIAAQKRLECSSTVSELRGYLAQIP